MRYNPYNYLNKEAGLGRIAAKLTHPAMQTAYGAGTGLGLSELVQSQGLINSDWGSTTANTGLGLYGAALGNPFTRRALLTKPRTGPELAVLYPNHRLADIPANLMHRTTLPKVLGATVTPGAIITGGVYGDTMKRVIEESGERAGRSGGTLLSEIAGQVGEPYKPWLNEQSDKLLDTAKGIVEEKSDEWVQAARELGSDITQQVGPGWAAGMTGVVGGGGLGGLTGLALASALSNQLRPKEYDAKGRKISRGTFYRTILPLMGLYGGTIAGTHLGSKHSDKLVDFYRNLMGGKG